MDNKLLGKEYRKLFLEGAKEITDYVKKTYGYNGHHLLIRSDITNTITNDGKNTAEAFNIRNPENDFRTEIRIIGSEKIKNATVNTDKKVKNGTTSTAILTYEGMKNLNKFINVRQVSKVKLTGYLKNLKSSLIEASKDLILNIDKDDRGTLYNIAYSSCRDSDMSWFIVDLLIDDNLNWSISNYKHDKYETIQKEGSRFRFNKIFSTKDSIDNVMFIYINSKVNNPDAFDILFEQAYKQNKNAVILANEVDKDIKMSISVLAEKYSIDAMVIDSKGLPEYETEDMLMMFDYQSKTVKSVIGFSYRYFDRVEIDDNMIVFKLDEYKANKYSNKKVKEFQDIIDDSNNYIQINALHKRINKLLHKDKIVKLKSNNANISSVKDKFIDTINYVFKAIQTTDVVIGGGKFFHELSLNVLHSANKLTNKDERLLWKYILQAFLQPQKEILNNSYVEPTYKQRKRIDNYYTYGYNAKDNEFTNLNIAGVIDPYETVMACIDSMFEELMLFAVTEGVIINKNNIFNNKGES